MSKLQENKIRNEVMHKINDEHRKLNGELREENKGLRLIIKEIVDTFKEIEDNSEYDFPVPWGKWQDVLDGKPVQLRLF